jgi:hypothetical protein
MPERDSESDPAPMQEVASPQSVEKLDLEMLKLRLEIADLSRSPWIKPSVLIPIVATLVTLGISQWLGVFDVERKRVEVAGKEAELQRNAVTKEVDALQARKTEVDGKLTQVEARKREADEEIIQLDQRKGGLALEVAQLQGQVVLRQNEISRLGRDLTKANQRALYFQHWKESNEVMLSLLAFVHPQEPLSYGSSGDFTATDLYVPFNQRTISATEIERLVNVMRQHAKPDTPITLEGHVGQFCVQYVEADPEQPFLAPPRLPLNQCKFLPSTEHTLALGDRQANAIGDALKKNGFTNVHTRSLDGKPKHAYPGGGTANDWNERAQLNNYISLVLGVR